MEASDSFRKKINHARGFLELEMLDEAEKVLEEISASERDHPLFFETQFRILIAEQKWEEGVAFAKTICQKHPEDEVIFILWAQCHYERGEFKAAREALQSGPPSLTETALYHYNMGCYSAALGEWNEAEKSIQQAISMDTLLWKIARSDPSLEAIRHKIKKPSNPNPLAGSN